MSLVPDWLKSLDPSAEGYLSLGLLVVFSLIVFRIARRVVLLGYFLLYFLIGFGIVYAASAYGTRSLQVPLAIPLAGGIAFAAAANFVRAKLMRVVSAVMLVALFALAGKFWGQYAGGSGLNREGSSAHAPAKQPRSKPSDQQEARAPFP